MTPATGIPWMDHALAIVGALTLFLTALANLLPKFSPFTQFLARYTTAADFRGAVPQAAALKEAAAQAVGTTTVKQDPVKVGTT